MTIKDLWLKIAFTGLWEIYEEGNQQGLVISEVDMANTMTDSDDPNHYLSEKEIKYFTVLPHPFYDDELVMRVCYKKGE